jgi:hypothetical protein
MSARRVFPKGGKKGSVGPQFADWGKSGTRDLRGQNSLSTEEETRRSGVYAFGARTTPIRWLRKRRVEGWGILESTPSGRGKHEFIHWGRDETFWSLRLRGEDNTNSLIAEKARSTDEGSWSLRLRGEENTSLSTEEETRRSGVYAFVGQQIFIDGGGRENEGREVLWLYAFGRHEFIHGGREARLRDERYGLCLRVMRKAGHLSLDKLQTALSERR